MEFVSLIFAALVLGLIPGAKAKEHGLALMWFYGALLFVVATPQAMLLTPVRHRMAKMNARRGYRHCPLCAELVRKKVANCPDC